MMCYTASLRLNYAKNLISVSKRDGVGSGGADGGGGGGGAVGVGNSGRGDVGCW